MLLDTAGFTRTVPYMAGKHQARRTWWQRTRDVADAFDRSPFSPTAAAVLLQRIRDRKTTHSGEPFTISSLTDEELRPQRGDYLDTVTAVLARASARNALQALRFRAQRCARGWSDIDVWNLDKHLCRTLADQLDYLAEYAVGYPGTPEYPTYDSWTSALRDNARKLRACDGAEGDKALDEWLTATTPEAGKAALDRMREIDERNETLADEGLHWVAANRRQLWD